MHPLLPFLLVFLSCTPVFAASDGGVPWFSLLSWAVPAIVAALGFFNAWKVLREGLNVAFDWLASKTHLRALAELDEVIIGFAIDLYQREIKVLKEEAGWNRKTKAAMLRVLIDRTKAHFGLETLAALFATGAAANLDGFIRSRAQAGITTAKARGRRPQANPTKK